MGEVKTLNNNTGEYMENIDDYRSSLSDLKAKPIDKDESFVSKVRSLYQRDRDRIMYEKSFRRLAGKTQVFVAGHDDYVRTRLTHTLEVTQIAKTISAFLGLEVDLTEAIALGHDIGHAPFGHVGERVINHFSNGCDNYKDSLNRDDYDSLNNWMGFKHNWQSIRIAETLARHKKEYGLDLTKQTLYGILHHTKLRYKKCQYLSNDHCTYRKRKKPVKCIDKDLCLNFYHEKYIDINNYKYFTVESIVVAIADEIAQIHHDIEDGLRNNIFSKNDLLKELEKIFTNKDLEEIRDLDKGKKTNNILEDTITLLSSCIVDYYVRGTIKHLSDYFKKINKYSELSETEIEIFQDENKFKTIFINSNDIQEFMKKRILNSHLAQVMDGRAEFLLRRLFKAFISNPQQLPDNTLMAFKRHIDNEYLDKTENSNDNVGTLRVDLDKYLNGSKKIIIGGVRYKLQKNRAILLRTICDYISGMTDRRAISEYQRLYGIDRDIRDL